MLCLTHFLDQYLVYVVFNIFWWIIFSEKKEFTTINSLKTFFYKASKHLPHILPLVLLSYQKRKKRRRRRQVYLMLLLLCLLEGCDELAVWLCAWETAVDKITECVRQLSRLSSSGLGDELSETFSGEQDGFFGSHSRIKGCYLVWGSPVDDGPFPC